MKLEEQWPELFFVAFIVVGFIIAVALRNSIFSYFSVFCGGFLAARVYYQKKMKEPIFPFILIIIGFLVGYLIGGIWVSRLLILLFFALGFVISFYLHRKKFLVIFKSENYIK